MKKIIKISDAEWEVMKILWEKSPRTSSEIVEILKTNTKWSATTIYTMIKRLVTKEAIKIEEGSSPYVCYPLVSQDKLRKEENKSFLRKVYDGSLNLMLSNLLKENKLSDDEIEDLKRILDESKKEK